MPFHSESEASESKEAVIRAILAKPFWDYEEAALVLNIEVKTLRNMKWKREITYTKFGRKIYLPRDVILRELRGNMVLCPATAVARRDRAAQDVA